MLYLCGQPGIENTAIQYVYDLFCSFQFNVPPLEGDVCCKDSADMSGGSYTTRLSDTQQFSAVQSISLGRDEDACPQVEFGLNCLAT